MSRIAMHEAQVLHHMSHMRERKSEGSSTCLERRCFQMRLGTTHITSYGLNYYIEPWVGERGKSMFKATIAGREHWKVGFGTTQEEALGDLLSEVGSTLAMPRN